MADGKQVTGTVKFFDVAKGYGFIRIDGGGQDVFLHITQTKKAGLEVVEKDDRVIFEIEDSDRGIRAINVSRL